VKSHYTEESMMGSGNKKEKVSFKPSPEKSRGSKRGSAKGKKQRKDYMKASPKNKANRNEVPLVDLNLE